MREKDSRGAAGAFSPREGGICAGAVQLRPARGADAAALLDIYAPYVRDTAVSFEYEVPSLEEFRGRMAAVTAAYPWLVAQVDGEVAGYAYAQAFHPRRAYAHCAEVTVYLRQDCRGRGLGRGLYTALEEELAGQGVRNLYACIALPEGEEDPYLTADSPAFHTALGYRLVGNFTRCGYKFGRWYSMVWMEKLLSSPDRQPHFRPQKREL